MTIGIMLSIGHHGEGYAAGIPTPKLADGGRFLFDQDFFGRRWLLLFQLTECFLSLLLPFGNGFGPPTEEFFGFFSRRFTLHPADVRELEQRHRIDIDIHVAANRDEDVNVVFLFAERYRLAIQESTVQDEPLHYAFACRLDKLFY